MCVCVCVCVTCVWMGSALVWVGCFCYGVCWGVKELVFLQYVDECRG